MLPFPSFLICISLGLIDPAEPRLSGIDEPTITTEFVWDARAVEHLLNRAGFGARPGEIEAGVRLGREALVERLLTQRADPEPCFIERVDEPSARDLRELSADDQRKAKNAARERDRRQLAEYTGWSLERMTSGEDPLLEKMTLFWHSFFTTSVERLNRSFEVLQQDQFLRANALGSYATLLHGIAQDPAMLKYLNNDVNRKGKPNENLAREIMELFSLGVGNFGEMDVKEAARALTGRTANKRGEYEWNSKQHDAGEKTILGQKGKFDGDGFVRVLLAQEACPRWVARRLITYFEGVEPEPDRLEEYAHFLRGSEYEIAPFLRKLFLDPSFYRDEIVGARVQGAVEYMVGTARRIGVRVPPGILGSGAALLGQRLFAPPTVKGWEEGYAWITTSTLMQRGNLAGLMLGVVKLEDVMNQADLEEPAESKPMTAGEGMQSGEMQGAPMETTGPTRVRDTSKKTPGKASKANSAAMQMLKRVEDSGWMPAVNFSARMKRAGASSDEAIVNQMCDELLAIDAPLGTRTDLRAFVAGERASLGWRDGQLLESGADAERLLRRLAHLILSLPEGQLL